ncbi:hypothetical protein H0H81_003546 [Sphagnurus paluster]|uniref:Uncharacterized protein n=1 Tax=Sphagnurus paluster TaxID=117069 RepID=A0A9P7FNQ7_9AGAR|nr:hypothetical protein H0H81_003546 [Sphagnurus paluster]
MIRRPPHSLPYTHSLDYITMTHELKRLCTWQLFYDNSQVSRLVRATLPTVSLKLHPFWQTLRLAWKHQDNPDRELGTAWEEEQRHLSKLAGDCVTTARVAHVILNQGYFGSFRQCFNLDGETICPTCQVIEMTNHIILDCPRFAAARHHITQVETQFNHLFPRNPCQTTLQHWLGSNKGIVALAHFLSRCNALKAPATLCPCTTIPPLPPPAPPPLNPGHNPPPQFASDLDHYNAMFDGLIPVPTFNPDDIG